MIDRIILSLCMLAFLASCSEVLDVASSDWKRYDWMREILGDQVVADSATHNIDTGEYRFVFTTPLRPDSAIAEFDERAAQSGWLVQKRDSLSRIYIRREQKIGHGEGYGCISIWPWQTETKFEFRYRATFDC